MSSSPIDTIGPLLLTVFTSILEVFLLCWAGYILAGRGILDKKTQKQLNRLNVSLFTPSLLFSKVAFFLSPAKLRELWIIPIFFILVTLVSMVVAFVLGWIFRLKRSQRSFAMAAAMFMNSNSLPIALMQSLVVTVPGLKWGQHDNKNAMVGRALTYLVLYSTLGMVLRWSYGVRLLAQADTEPIREPDETSHLLGRDDASSFTSTDAPTTLHHEPSMSSSTHINGDDFVESPIEDVNDVTPHIVVEDPNRLRVRPTLIRSHTNVFHSFPNTPNQSHSRLPSYSSYATTTSTINSTTPTPSPSDSGDESDNNELPTTRRHHPSASAAAAAPPRSRFKHTLRHCRRRIVHWWHNLNEFMTVPLWAALASIIVACIRPIQHALDEHMQPVKGALAAAGSCSIPLTLIVLGAYFYPPPEEKPSEGERSRENTGLSTVKSASSLMNSVRKILQKRHGETHHHQSHAVNYGGTHIGGGAQQKEKRPGETTTVAIAVLSRMIITPLLLLPLMAISSRFDIQAVFADPVFVVSNVLLISSPPALTLAQITQAASGDAFERLISRTIFWAYCIVTPPATIIFVVIGLLLAKL